MPWRRSRLIPQIVWNRSTRRAGERDGARVGRLRWLRILTIEGAWRRVACARAQVPRRSLKKLAKGERLR